MSNEVSRRNVLLMFAGTTMVIACGDDTSAGDAGDASVADTATGADGATCAVTPEGEVGPYFADDSDAAFNRSNILSNLDGSNTQTGIPLTLTITVLDGKNGCAPYAGAQIDVWHCNASGVYSDIAAESTSSEQWLRGYQITDAAGNVTFVTIIPGWYSGRTTHIHLRVRSSYDDAAGLSDGTNTTQLFFDQTLVDTVDTTIAPYSAEGQNPTTNAGDRVYSQQENGANQLTLVGDATNGYSASVTIVVPITTEASDAGTQGNPPGMDGGPPPPFDAGPPPADADDEG